MAKYHLHLAHLYGDLLNTYGDIGNIIALKYYAKQMDTDIQVDVVSIEDDFDPDQFDIAFFGGGQDYEQMVVSKDIQTKKDGIKKFIEDGKPMLAICGGYQLLGKYYVGADGEKIPGIGVLDHYTLTQSEHRSAQQNQSRFIGDVEIQNEDTGAKFHGLGHVLAGHGNNGEDGTEGAIYLHTYCSYFHGPILTRNGELAKQMLLEALSIKYPDADLTPQEGLIVQPTF